MGARAETTEVIARLLARIGPRAKSLLVTVYGDAILPHGGSTWLGSLIRLAAPLGLSERTVRTAVYRLTQDGILAPTQRGRRSYYVLSEAGRRQFEAAQQRIYGVGNRAWDGTWLVAIAPQSLSSKARESLCREFALLGFGQRTGNIFLHASADRGAVRDMLDRQGLADRIVLLDGGSSETASDHALATLVSDCWALDALDLQYREFLDIFAPVAADLNSGTASDPELYLLLRVLLIHAFRRVLLRDPALPPDLLPADWSGTAARRLCGDLYRRIAGPAEQHLVATHEGIDGAMPPAEPAFLQRFGGLEEVRADPHVAR